MKQTPVFITEYGLARLLKEFAQRLGVEESMADAMAQVHIQQTNTHLGWSEFISHNCFRCFKAPQSCDFLNPKPSNCAPGTTPENVKSANAMVVERGSLKVCPARVDPTDARLGPEDSRIRDQQAQDSPAEGEEE
jgi:hypothetical protein